MAAKLSLPSYTIISEVGTDRRPLCGRKSFFHVDFSLPKPWASVDVTSTKIKLSHFDFLVDLCAFEAFSVLNMYVCLSFLNAVIKIVMEKAMRANIQIIFAVKYVHTYHVELKTLVNN